MRLRLVAAADPQATLVRAPAGGYSFDRPGRPPPPEGANRRMKTDVVYKIVPRPLWAEAEHTGVFHGSPVDLADGFIHFSSVAQVAETANRHFAGMDDLLLVAVDAGGLGAALRYEPSRGGALFPHLYAPLTIDRVRWVKPLPLGADGRHVFPDLGAEA